MCWHPLTRQTHMRSSAVRKSTCFTIGQPPPRTCSSASASVHSCKSSQVKWANRSLVALELQHLFLMPAETLNVPPNTGRRCHRCSIHRMLLPPVCMIHSTVKGNTSHALYTRYVTVSALLTRDKTGMPFLVSCTFRVERHRQSRDPDTTSRLILGRLLTSTAHRVTGLPCHDQRPSSTKPTGHTPTTATAGFCAPDLRRVMIEIGPA